MRSQMQPLRPPKYANNSKVDVPTKSPIQRKENRTGMPSHLKSGLEHLSGTDLSDVKVHYNSDKPAKLQAAAYAEGNQIHIGPSQEEHLPHEGWHVVQQKQGRVQPTMSAANINDDPSLEQEADVMGSKASMYIGPSPEMPEESKNVEASMTVAQGKFMPVVQRIAYHTIDYDQETVQAFKGAEEMTWEVFQADYVELYNKLNGGSIVKLTDNGKTAIVYDESGTITESFKQQGDDWIEVDDDYAYSPDEVDYALDGTVPEDPTNLEIAQKLRDGTEDEDAVNAELPKIYKSVADIPDIDRAVNNMPEDATAYEWVTLLTRLTSNPSRKIIADVLKAGNGSFSASALMRTLTANSQDAADRVAIAASWGNNDIYLNYANNMQIKNNSPASHLLGTRLAATVDAEDDIEWEVFQPDVHYAGGKYQGAQPRTAFLKADIEGVEIEIHAHWFRKSEHGQTAGKITSMHIQEGGKNGLEINQWSHLSNLKNEIIKQFNAGANPPSGADDTGTLIIT
ncbi:DUF4157 domain-containing protein [Paenibacillus sp. V4I3]|uniref:eCIS core domain-containing protein n=2 Tax=unclassified Paenibacillus TaxID=185978 RepID=UPI0027D7B2ED|nr:DUF4157 domain-containing protein [Paenibacillus sp. V4I3]